MCFEADSPCQKNTILPVKGGLNKGIKIMKASSIIAVLVAAVGFLRAMSVQAQVEIPFTDTFFLEDCQLGSRGVNDYFLPLKPGAYLLLEGEEDGEELTLFISLLSRTKKVAGVTCAILQEVEWEDGELVEVSHNYIAICRRCHDVFYFGEDVDIYEDGEVISHDGAWLAGTDGAQPGLLMPGRPLNGARYYQEIAPGVALDRAEHLDDKATIDTPAMVFENCLLVGETTPLEPADFSLKGYARGIGMVQDEVLRLVAWGRDPGFSFEPEEED
jgi:hypothetical protein